jgi:hypothetical protein
MLELFQVTYQTPGHPVVTERGLTREGADKLQGLVLKAGGWGSCMPIPGGINAMGPQSKASAARERAERAFRLNAAARKRRFDNYLVSAGQRGRGYFT